MTKTKGSFLFVDCDSHFSFFGMFPHHSSKGPDSGENGSGCPMSVNQTISLEMAFRIQAHLIGNSGLP